MAEYIEREALLEKRWDVPFETEDSHFVQVVDVGDIIAAPPADVAPVRHCEWALVEKGPDRDIYRCPWCGRTIDTIFVESEVAKQFPYCHCGTKMDRGGINVKTKRKKPGKPRGVTYADILAEKQARMRAIDRAAADGMVELRANAHTQRAMWLMVCSVADAYGFGPERMKLFLETLQSNAEELQRMIDEVDEDYAYEKMRRKAEQVTGEKLEYYIDVELKKSRERNAGVEGKN